jgi:integrase
MSKDARPPTAPASPRKAAFTEARLHALKPPAEGRVYVYDSRTPGLALCMTAAGAKVFYRCGRVAGRYHRVRLGRWPAVTVEAARKAALQLGGQIAAGANPVAERRKDRQAATLAEGYEAYMMHGRARWRPATVRCYELAWRLYLKPLAKRRLADLNRDDLARLHLAVGKKHGLHSGNRALALVSSIFNHFAPDLPNPTKGVKRFKESPRDRFLNGDELQAFFAALQAEAPLWQDFFAVLLLTAARRGAVAAMRFDDLDLGRGLWRVPEASSKNREPMVLLLPAQAVAILARRAAKADPANPWVFPSPKGGGVIQEPKRAWAHIVKRAGLADVRMHDLRRTLASWAAMNGASLQFIARMLGHRDTRSTEIYARLMTDTVRPVLEGTVLKIMEAANGAAPRPEAPAPDAPALPPPAGPTPANGPAPAAATPADPARTPSR